MSTDIEIYKPKGFADRKAPRVNLRKFRHKIITKELYNRWLKTTSHKISFDEFKRIWKLVALEIQLSAIEETDGIVLPHGIGEIYLGYTKVKDRPIDYNLSRQYNTIIYHDNFHSYGKLGKIIYSPCGKYQLRNCDLWSFTPITPFRTRAKAAFKEYPERYKNSRQKNYYGYTPNRSTNIPDTQPAKDS